MDTYVDPHLQWRTLTEADLDDLASLRQQIEALDDPVLSAVERIVGEADVASMEATSIGGWDDYGNLLAYGWNIVRHDGIPRVHLTGGIHPTHRYLGIGRSLVRWQVECAREWRDEHHPGEALWLGCYVDLGQPGLAKVLDALGFARERYFYDMYRELRHLPEPREVPGVEIAGFAQTHWEPVRDLHNRCFADPHGVEVVSSEHWEASLRRPSFRPDWSWVALVDGRPVGYALSGVDEAAGMEEAVPADVVLGWTDRVGVDPGFRGRGIALALLTRSLHSMARGGCIGAGLGVDTTDPASPALLSEELGYEARDGLVLMSRIAPA